MPNSLYDLYLGDKDNLQGYRLRSFVRDSAPQIAPKFSSGSQGQSDLDLLKVKTWASFRGGMFQREWKDDEKGARVYGLYNMVDENLYHAPAVTSLTTPATYTGTGHYVSAECTYYNGAYVAHREGSTNKLHHINTSGTVTNIVLPAAVSGGACAITGLVFHKGYLFVCGQNSAGNFNNHRYNIALGTWQDIGGGYTKLAVLRGQLYGVNFYNTVYLTTNEEAAGSATYTLITTFAHSSTTLNLINSFEEFNGALYIAVPQGLYRFDGALAVPITNQSISYLTKYNGALYYVQDGWLYRFDGSNIERLQYFGAADNIHSLKVVGDYLCIGTSPSSSVGKYVTGEADGTIDSRLYTWDGIGFQMIYEADAVQGSSQISSVGSRVLICTTANGSFSYGYLSLDLGLRFRATSSSSTQPLEIVTSEFDDGFPNINKSLEYVEVDYNDIHANDSIVVSYQYFNGINWSSWITLGTLTSTSDTNKIEVIASGSVVKLAKGFKIRAVANSPLGTASSLSLRNLSIYYTLQPRHRWRWQAQLMAGGSDSVSPIMDRSGTALSNDANELSILINKSIKSKTPIFMLAPDYSVVDSLLGVSAVDTLFRVGGRVSLYTDPYAEYPLVAVKNEAGVWEILRVRTVTYNAIDDNTEITVAERGYLGITPGEIDDGAEFHLAYKVYVTRLQRDALILDENTYNEQTTGESQLKREYLVEIIEV